MRYSGRVDYFFKGSPGAGLFNIQNWVVGREKVGNPSPPQPPWGPSFNRYHDRIITLADHGIVQANIYDREHFSLALKI